MALLKPLYMEAASGDPAISYSAALDRLGLLGAMFSREGVLDKDAGHLQVTQRSAGANFSVDVAAGRCSIFGDDVSDQGTYVCINTTPVNLAVPAKPASGSRTHRVVARVRDRNANGTWSGYDWSIEILADSGSGTPALPNTAITLALVTVTSSTVSVTGGNIADQRSRATVGTAYQTGDMLASGIHSAYGGRDLTRPLTWARSPDGWVYLAGWLRRSGGSTGILNGQIYPFDGVSINDRIPQNTARVLPADACPTGIRDFTGITAAGPVNFAVYPSGGITFRFPYAFNMDNNTWFSFDGCSFRASSF
jgi:hypothetical protein